MYIVTGVSRGLGKAIAEKLLGNGENVLGIGRNSIIEHKNYTFKFCDLSDPEQVSNLRIEISEETVTLINNAGILGEVKRLSDQIELCLSDVLQVNTVAPMTLSNHIYKQLKNKNNFTLVNISSGAANQAIPSWASYCASKAALNMLSEAFYLEELEKGNSPKVYAVAPGVIDTDMQNEIRTTDLENFSSLNKFIQLKEESQLFSSEEAAIRLIKLLSSANTQGVFADLRQV